MIGIMNVGSHESVEVYGSPKYSSMYDRKKVSKDVRTYMENGRVMVNGVPTLTETSDQLWAGLIRKMILIQTVKVEEKPGLFAKLFRLWASKTHKDRKSEKQNKTKEPAVIVHLTNDSDNITRIEISTQATEKPNFPDVVDKMVDRHIRNRQEKTNWSPKASRVVINVNNS